MPLFGNSGDSTVQLNNAIWLFQCFVFHAADAKGHSGHPRLLREAITTKKSRQSAGHVVRLTNWQVDKSAQPINFSTYQLLMPLLYHLAPLQGICRVLCMRSPVAQQVDGGKQRLAE